jgi:hypothetical protein
VAGYSTLFDVSSAGRGSFEFITVRCGLDNAITRQTYFAPQVRGGRHEVPETAPQQAFEMLKVGERGFLQCENP